MHLFAFPSLIRATGNLKGVRKLMNEIQRKEELEA
jgi:hypothetical protein